MEASSDWGGIVHRRPKTVVRPKSIRDVQAAVRHGLPVAARGGGHSCYGQGQTDGIVIDMTGLSEVEEMDGDTVAVGAGALWSQVLTRTLPAGLTPPVLTDYLRTSVGGTLSVGGIGGATQHHGMQADNVLSLDVVTGSGELVRCSPTEHRDLFDAVRGGLGQFGIIVRATLRLVAAPHRARRYVMHYKDFSSFFADQRRVLRDGRFPYLEGQIVEDEYGNWRPLIEGAAFDGPARLDDLALQREEVEDLPYWDFLDRVAPGEELLRATGEWFHQHPWLNLFLPDAVVEEFVAELRPSRAELGNSGLILLYPFRRDRVRTPLVRLPDGEIVWLLALLRVSDPREVGWTDRMIAANRMLYERAVASGGVAYPINALPMTSTDWRVHFGPRWTDLVVAKDRYDPNRMLTPGQGIF
jgi:cytokinin dehydrogenase